MAAPPDPPAEPTDFRGTSGTRARTRPQLLVVEDDAILRESLVALLMDEGFEVIAVSGLVAARAVLADKRTAVLVLDLTLEGEFGADLLAELASTDHAPATVIVSAFQLANLVADRYGVDVIRKPFAITDVVARVRAAMAERRRPRLAREA
jgi:DNA-binding response OmpR family regulator